MATLPPPQNNSPNKGGKSRSGGAGPKKLEFSAEDLENMVYQAHLTSCYDASKQAVLASVKQVNEADAAVISEISGAHEPRTIGQLKMIKANQLEALCSQKKNLSETTTALHGLTELLGLFNDNSASARILSRQLSAEALISLCQEETHTRRVKDKQQWALIGSEESKQSELIDCPSVFEEELRSIPHIKSTFEYKPPDRPIRPVDPSMANMPKPPPGMGRTIIERNPNAHLMQQQTGMSITQGNYLNVGRNDTSNMVPTWQQQQQNPRPPSKDGKDFYKDFITAPDVVQNPFDSKKRNDQQGDWWEQYGGNQQKTTQYQPPFAGAGNNTRKDNRFVDQVYKSYGNLANAPDHVKQRVNNLIENYGDDFNVKAFEKQAKKKGWLDENQGGQDHMKMNEPQGFKSGLNAFKDEMKKKNKGYEFDNRKECGYSGRRNKREQERNEAEEYYSNQKKEEKDDRSATEKLFDNQSGKSGLSGRRRFVPPGGKTEGYGGGIGHGTGGNAGYHPGRSVMDQCANGQKQDKDKKEEKKEGDPDNPHADDERYKNLDPRMVETIENEIMEKDCKITWDDIAGLEFAKKTINEIIIWPMLRPDIFKGIRAPPRGIMFFGPPGTGKTLLGKAIACQSKSTFMSISASTLTSKWVGEGEKMVRTMFAIAAIHQPSVVFIDEIDSLLCARNDADQEGSRRIKTEFLVQLDGANTFGTEESRILIIGATNRPHDLDEAVRRRLGKRLYIPMPNAAGRRQFFHRMIEREFKNDESVANMLDMSEDDIEKLILKTIGYSGSDLKSLSTEAAMIPMREITDVQNCELANIRPVKLEDFFTALDNVRKSVNAKDIGKYHEWNDNYGSFPIREEDLKD